MGRTGVHVGAMADQVLNVCPGAVEMESDGYYAIDYSMIDVAFERLSV